MTTATEHKIPTGILKQVPLKDIVVGERFRKDFSNDENFRETIREKGVLQPITLTKDLRLLAGERRYRAAVAVGLEKIPALLREIDGEIDAREIELIENIERKDFTWWEECQIVAAIDKLYREKDITWSGRKTAQLINQSKSNVARDLEMAEALEFLPELREQPTQNDAFKVLNNLKEQVVVKELAQRQRENLALADAVATGQAPAESTGPTVAEYVNRGYSPDLAARLRQADNCYRVEDVFTGLADLPDNNMWHLIECDPPYGIDLTAVKGSKDSAISTVHSYEEVPAADYKSFLDRLAKELYRVADRNAWLVFWFGPTWFTEVKAALLDAGWKVDDIPAIWVKNQGQTLQPEVYLARQYEPFFIARKGQPYLPNRGRSNVFTYNTTPASKKYHPTERPIELISSILLTFAVPGQRVLVPFLGSGCTLRAAFKNNMNGMGFDVNGEYKDRFLLAVEEDFKNQPKEDDVLSDSNDE